MRVLVLHSDIAPDAPPDEQDTLVQAQAVAHALQGKGHAVTRAAFVPDKAAFAARLQEARADIVFNLVESVWGSGQMASLAPAFLAASSVLFTGTGAAAMAATGDKLLSKRLMRAGGVDTPPWSEPPRWEGLARSGRWIVKSADEDASLGLDDGSVVQNEGVAARALSCAARHGGHWFAERYIAGREFNAAVLEREGAAHVLPIAEMRFERWDPARPQIVGYGAKWDAGNADFHNTVRDFTWSEAEPGLRKSLADVAAKCWHLFALRGYARVDFRVDRDGRPFVLEVNANPCLSPDAGFAAAAAEAGFPYDDLVAHILSAAIA